jgi:hypothetical protein
MDAVAATRRARPTGARVLAPAPLLIGEMKKGGPQTAPFHR